jgi:hypothetical protein
LLQSSHRDLQIGGPVFIQYLDQLLGLTKILPHLRLLARRALLRDPEFVERETRGLWNVYEDTAAADDGCWKSVIEEVVETGEWLCGDIEMWQKDRPHLRTRRGRRQEVDPQIAAANLERRAWLA